MLRIGDALKVFCVFALLLTSLAVTGCGSSAKLPGKYDDWVVLETGNTIHPAVGDCIYTVARPEIDDKYINSDYNVIGKIFLYSKEKDSFDELMEYNEGVKERKDPLYQKKPTQYLMEQGRYYSDIGMLLYLPDYIKEGTVVEEKKISDLLKENNNFSFLLALSGNDGIATTYLYEFANKQYAVQIAEKSNGALILLSGPVEVK